MIIGRLNCDGPADGLAGDVPDLQGRAAAERLAKGGRTATGDQGPAIVGERQGYDKVGVGLQGRLPGRGGDVPDDHSASRTGMNGKPAPDGQPRAIGGKGQAAHRGGEPAQRRPRRPGSRVPEHHRPVHASRGQDPTVWGKDGPAKPGPRRVRTLRAEAISQSVTPRPAAR